MEVVTHIHIVEQAIAVIITDHTVKLADNAVLILPRRIVSDDTITE